MQELQVTIPALPLVVVLASLLVGVGARGESNVPSPIKDIPSLTADQTTKISEIVRRTDAEIGAAKKKIEKDRTEIHQRMGTMSSLKMDILEWTRNATNGARLAERQKIAEVLTPKQRAEATAALEKLVQQVAIDEFDLVHANQETQVWCWAACLQMLLNYNGVAWTQKDVVNEIKGELVREDATGEEVAKGIQGWKKDEDPRKTWSAQCEWKKEPPPADMIVQSLSINRPILVALDGQHVVVLHEAAYRETPKGYVVESVTIFDPRTGKDFEMKWPTEAAKRISGHWYTWVAAASSRLF